MDHSNDRELIFKAYQDLKYIERKKNFHLTNKQKPWMNPFQTINECSTGYDAMLTITSNQEIQTKTAKR